MLRQAIESLRLFLTLFQDIPPMPRTILWPGAALMLAYPLLSILLGPGEEGQAFVTAFVMALAVRLALRFETVIRRLAQEFGTAETMILGFASVFLPLAILTGFDDPLWCQRSQSAYSILVGALFLSDMLAGRTEMAARFWPWPQMQAHLASMTRVMVLYYLAFLLLNETMIRTLDATQWLIFWAVLPVISHVVLSALILTVINTDDDRDAHA